METKTDRPKKDFWRYGPEISEHDVLVFYGCEFEDCTLCDQERQGKCQVITDIINPVADPIVAALNKLATDIQKEV